MAEPGVGGGATLSPPFGESVPVTELDMGMRDYDCTCGDTHAVVTDVHPLARFVPEFLEEVLTETVETADDYPTFATPHLMGMVLEEFPDQVAVADVSEDGDVGYALVWLTGFDSRRLHEVVVELVVELMDHAISHADDDGYAESSFEQELAQFDVEAFVDQYREEREFDSEHDSAV
jgi:hypothetical protein